MSILQQCAKTSMWTANREKKQPFFKESRMIAHSIMQILVLQKVIIGKKKGRDTVAAYR